MSQPDLMVPRSPSGRPSPRRRLSRRQQLGVALVLLLGLPISLWPLIGVQVELDSCGIHQLRYDGQIWTVPPPQPFDATTAPPRWTGFGVVLDVEDGQLRYLDFSGARLTFRSGYLDAPRCA